MVKCRLSRVFRFQEHRGRIRSLAVDLTKVAFLGSRLVDLYLTSYNPATDLLTVCRTVFSFAASGQLKNPRPNKDPEAFLRRKLLHEQLGELEKLLPQAARPVAIPSLERNRSAFIQRTGQDYVTALENHLLDRLAPV